MKWRIIENHKNMFIVQHKKSFWNSWENDKARTSYSYNNHQYTNRLLTKNEAEDRLIYLKKRYKEGYKQLYSYPPKNAFQDIFQSISNEAAS